jgi:hypothetical protein
MWTNGRVKIVVSESGRRTFYTKTPRSGGGASSRGVRNESWVRTSQSMVREQYPSVRLPSAKSIVERSAGRNIAVTIENNTGRTLYVAFYDRNGPYLERRLVAKEAIPVMNPPITSFVDVKGPRWKWATRQYMVVAFEQNQFPLVATLDRFGPRAARIGFNVGSGKQFLVSGDTPETLQFD